MFEAVDVDRQGCASGAVRPRNCRLHAATSLSPHCKEPPLGLVTARTVRVCRLTVCSRVAGQIARSCLHSIHPPVIMRDPRIPR